MNNSFSKSPAGYVFISYSRRDKQFVNQLTSDLQSRGFSVWVDTKGIPTGSSDWEKNIRAAIAGARSVIYVASPRALDSKVVRDELQIAEDYQRHVHILLIDGKKHMESIPLGRGYTQYIDVRGRYDAAFWELVQALNSPRPETAMVPVPPSTRSDLPAPVLPASNAGSRRSSSVPRRVTQATISSIFVCAITTFVVTFIIKVFSLVINAFSVFASMAGKSNADPAPFFAVFGQIADFSNPLPLVIGIVAGVLAAILTISFFTK